MSKLFVGDVGTVITLDSGQDLTGYTATIKYIKPDGTVGSWSASVSGTSASYTTIAGDLNLEGDYKLQLYVTKAATWTGHGEIVVVKVYNTL